MEPNALLSDTEKSIILREYIAASPEMFHGRNSTCAIFKKGRFFSFHFISFFILYFFRRPDLFEREHVFTSGEEVQSDKQTLH